MVTNRIKNRTVDDLSVDHAATSPRTPNLIDAHVGKRVRQRRQYLGLSQGELAARLELTFQQIQKYELGINRISASRLFILAKALETRVGWFFEDYDSYDLQQNTPEESPLQQFSSRETGDLLRAYYNMSRARQRLLLAWTLELGPATEE